jgi:putative oxidoreductase
MDLRHGGYRRSGECPLLHNSFTTRGSFFAAQFIGAREPIGGSGDKARDFISTTTQTQHKEQAMNSLSDLGKLILRLVLGLLILMHGISKLKNGVDFIGPALASHGLPVQLAYLAYIGEVLAPILLIIGLWTRVGGLIVVINMLFALGLMHMSQLGDLSKSGGWALELQAMYLFTALSIALLGAGRLSVGGTNGRFN